jgi:hypothetical protein
VVEDNGGNIIMNFPFKEHTKDGYNIRTFSQKVDNEELMWHRDKEDRIVESIGDTDWMIQLDDKLPQPLTEKVFIPKEVYHRVIKGSGKLIVKVKKL